MILSGPKNWFCWAVVVNNSENTWSEMENLALNKIFLFLYIHS